MIDLQKKKYMNLIGLVEDLEDELESLEKQDSADNAEVERIKAELNKYRDELQRVSNGCGYPHHH
jgi:peptidoglycan hydrolase CwlO-like protein